VTKKGKLPTFSDNFSRMLMTVCPVYHRQRKFINRLKYVVCIAFGRAYL